MFNGYLITITFLRKLRPNGFVRFTAALRSSCYKSRRGQCLRYHLYYSHTSLPVYLLGQVATPYPALIPTAHLPEDFFEKQLQRVSVGFCPAFPPSRW